MYPFNNKLDIVCRYIQFVSILTFFDPDSRKCNFGCLVGTPYTWPVLCLTVPKFHSLANEKASKSYPAFPPKI